MDDRQEFLDQILNVAKQSLTQLEAQLTEVSPKDLVAVFNATVKAYKYLSLGEGELDGEDPEERHVMRRLNGLAAQQQKALEKQKNPVKTRTSQLLDSLM